MLARLAFATIRGLDAEAVDVEVDLSRGLPAWNMVGLPEAAVPTSMPMKMYYRNILLRPCNIGAKKFYPGSLRQLMRVKLTY